MNVREICESTESLIAGNGSVPQNALRRAVDLPEERTEERTKTHACDCISRQAALEALSHMMDTDGFRDGWSVSRANVDCMLRSLPSVEPERNPELGKFIEKVFETLREMDDAVDVICNLDVDAVLDRMEVDR